MLVDLFTDALLCLCFVYLFSFTSDWFHFFHSFHNQSSIFEELNRMEIDNE